MYRRKRMILQNHAIQDGLEDTLLKLKPKMDILNDLEKLHQSTGDKNLGMQVDKQRKELNDQINEITKKTGVSFTDAYAKLQGEKIKNDVLEGREKALQRMKDGKGDDDTIDLLDENGILITRIKNMEELSHKEHPANYLETGHKNWLKHLEGHHIEDLDYDKDYDDHARQKHAELLGITADDIHVQADEYEGEHRVRQDYGRKIRLPKFVIPRKTKLSAGLQPHATMLRNQEYINQESQKAQVHQREREDIQHEIHRKLFGKKVIEGAKGLGKAIKQHKEQVFERGSRLAKQIKEREEQKALQENPLYQAQLQRPINRQAEIDNAREERKLNKLAEARAKVQQIGEKYSKLYQPKKREASLQEEEKKSPKRHISPEQQIPETKEERRERIRKEGLAKEKELKKQGAIHTLISKNIKKEAFEKIKKNYPEEDEEFKEFLEQKSFTGDQPTQIIGQQRTTKLTKPQLLEKIFLDLPKDEQQKYSFKKWYEKNKKKYNTSGELI